MTNSAYHQSSFLGGTIGPLSQGRSDLPLYKQSLNVCVNGIIAEEGAWVRRSGFQFLAKTNRFQPATLLPFFHSLIDLDLVMEITDSLVRFFNGTSICLTTVQSAVTASSFAAGVLTLTVESGTGFAVLDGIMLWSPQDFDPAKIQAFRGRVMRVTGVAGAVLTVKDDSADGLGAAFVGLSSTANDLVGTVVYQVAHLASPWVGSDREAVRGVQVPNVLTGSYMQILSQVYAPRAIKISAALAATITTEAFVDGPYLDQQGTFEVPETGTVSAYSGSITFTPLTSTFVAADVGRHIRLFQEPPAWASGTTYSYGQVVTYNGGWWSSVGSGTYAANVGFTPGTPGTFSGVQVTMWAAAPDQGVWAWGTITAQAGTSATVLLVTPLKSANGTAIAIWRKGLFTAGQYPTCGVIHDGRLWYGGALPGRFDASMSNNFLAFSPTEANGQVNDNNAISYTVNARGSSSILWMERDEQGVLLGTPSSEWIIHSLTDGPVTPTNVSCDRVTKFGCADMEPVRCDMSLVFVQRYHRSIIEHLPEGFTAGRFVGRNLNGFAKHYMETGVEQLAYQQETVPVVWARMTDGTLAGCTYRRTSRFITEAPVVEAWHQHIIGGNYDGDVVRPVTGMCAIPSPEGLADNLYLVSSDVDGADNFIQVSRPLFEEA